MKSQIKTMQIYKIERTNCQQTLKTKISLKKFTNTRKRQRYDEI